jgi:hypothetical protein
VQDEIDRQRSCRGIVAARRVVARCQLRRIGRIHRTVGARGRQHRLGLSRLGEEEFHVIVMRGADEAGELVPSDRDAQHLRRDPACALHFQEA